MEERNSQDIKPGGKKEDLKEKGGGRSREMGRGWTEDGREKEKEKRRRKKRRRS